MSNTNLSAVVAAYLLYIAKGETPHDAIELALIDTKPSIMLEKNYDRMLRSAMRSVFSFLHPEVPERIKSGAFYLQDWFLNVDALEAGEFEQIQKYIEDMKNYFKQD